MKKLYILNKFQVSKIEEEIRYTTAREKAMSILAYLTRLQSYGAIIKTYKDLHFMHQKSTKRLRIKFESFKKIMKKLIDIGLIQSDDKSKNNIHTYTVIFSLPKKLPRILPNEKHNETTETTTLEASDVSYSNKVNNNNIYNNNFTAGNENYGRTLGFEEGQSLVENLLNSMKIKSQFVKQLAFLKVGKVFNKINISGAEAYIIKLIQDLINENRIRFQYRKNQFNNQINKYNSGKFNQQVAGFREKNYDYDALQRELLGWDD